MTDLYHPRLSARPAWDGRRSFLRAVVSLAPDVLSALAGDVFAEFKRQADAIGIDRCMWYRFHVAFHPTGETLPRAGWHEVLRDWQRGFHIEAGWVGLVAFDTLATWYRSGGPQQVDWTLPASNWRDDPIVELKEDGAICVIWRRPDDLAPIREEEIALPPALAEGRPRFAERERERLRKRELRKRGWLPLPKREPRKLITTPADWAVLWQVREFTWPEVQAESGHAELATLRGEVAAFLDSIGLERRRGEPGPPRNG